MNRILKVGLVLGLVSLANVVNAKDCDKQCQLKAVETYFQLADKIFRKGSTESDIDTFLAAMHDDVKYLHVVHYADFDKEKWRKAFLARMSEGAYDNTDKNEIKILNSISGKNYLAVEYSHGEIDDKGEWISGDPLLVLFGFKDGKISLIEELW